jgi:ribosomal peptide maturation radical SAM protein 1
MTKIILINMPFSSVLRPAIGLTQIKFRLEQTFGDRVSVDVLYLNIDFSRYVGINFYNEVAESMEHHPTGLGDWLFRQLAFPELPDNTDEYFQRCYPHPTERNVRLRKLVESHRSKLAHIFETLISGYRLDQADIIGLSSTFAQTAASFAMVRMLKERRPDLITVMGGANCESNMGREIAKNFRWVDFVFSGPALVSFPRFVQHYLAGEPEKMHSIPGVFSQANQRATLPVVGQTACATVGEELDINTRIDLDYREYLSKFAKSYPSGQFKVSLPFETSRGCWWGAKAHCTFCGLNGETMSYRSMTSDGAISLLQSLFQYAGTCSRFDSVDNIMPRHYIEEVFGRISVPSSVQIFYEVKADLNDRELGILSKAGVRLIQPGIESLSTSTLRLMKKGTTATGNVEFLRNCLMNEVVPFWNLLVGFPGEEETVYQKYCADIPLLTHLSPPSGAFPVRFDRFSPYFDKAAEYKLDLHPMAYYFLTYPFNEEALYKMAYYFKDHNSEAKYYGAMVKWVAKIQQTIDQWHKLWNKEKRPNWTPPKLYFTDSNSGNIFDSRSGQVLQHDVGERGRKMLEHLSRPRSASTLAQDFPDFESDLNRLKEKRLVFIEGDKYVNLVCPREPQMRCGPWS